MIKALVDDKVPRRSIEEASKALCDAVVELTIARLQNKSAATKYSLGKVVLEAARIGKACGGFDSITLSELANLAHEMEEAKKSDF